jgi:hypothetical protein
MKDQKLKKIKLIMFVILDRFRELRARRDKLNEKIGDKKL